MNWDAPLQPGEVAIDIDDGHTYVARLNRLCVEFKCVGRFGWQQLYTYPNEIVRDAIVDGLPGDMRKVYLINIAG